MKVHACMGGFCDIRGACPHYHAEDRSEPVERLCTPGHDGDRVQQATESHKARLAADPRFALWAALEPKP